MASGSAPARYQLSSTLAGHNADVRALVGCPRAHLAASSSSSSATADSDSSGSGALYDAQRPVLFSTSRDGTARGWVCRGGQAQQDGGAAGGGWVEGPVFGGVGSAGHEGFVNAVEWMHAAPEAPGGEFLFALLAVRSSSPASGAAGGRVNPLARRACAGATFLPLRGTDTVTAY